MSLKSLKSKWRLRWKFKKRTTAHSKIMIQTMCNTRKMGERQLVTCKTDSWKIWKSSRIRCTILFLVWRKARISTACRTSSFASISSGNTASNSCVRRATTISAIVRLRRAATRNAPTTRRVSAKAATTKIITRRKRKCSSRNFWHGRTRSRAKKQSGRNDQYLLVFNIYLRSSHSYLDTWFLNYESFFISWTISEQFLFLTF